MYTFKVFFEICFLGDMLEHIFHSKEDIMAVLSELEPNKVFKYFEEICSIPHGSNNVNR